MKRKKIKDTFDHCPTPSHPTQPAKKKIKETLGQNHNTRVTFFFLQSTFTKTKYISKNYWNPNGYAMHLPSGDKTCSRKKKGHRSMVILKM